MSQSFYKFLEDKHRGSRELILSRLGFYKQFIIPVKDTLSSIQAIDLGCGRGEWLELITEAGYNATGIDIESDMLADCITRGLNVQNRDALEYLKTKQDNSVAIISGFHVVEHLPFEYLMELVQEALRVLAPAGLLILETPNSENIMVGTDSFYIDPTHIKPIPDQLLSIIPEFAGFYRIKTVRLQENPLIMEKENFSLIDVFSGVSPDYAIIAQKNGSDSQLKVLDHAFDCEYGIQLSELCAFYDKKMMENAKGIVVEQNKNIESTINELSKLLQNNLDNYNNLSVIVIQDAKDKLNIAENKIFTLESEILKLKEQMAQEIVHAKELAEYWHSQSDRWYKQVLAIHSSTSWVITKPIRILKRGFSFPIKIELTLKRGMKILLQHSALYISKRKYLRTTTLFFLNRVPFLKKRLFDIAINPAWRSNINDLSNELNSSGDNSLLLLDNNELSIYKKLKNALNEN